MNDFFYSDDIKNQEEKEVQLEDAQLRGTEPKFITLLKALLVAFAGFFAWYLINFAVQIVFSIAFSAYVAIKNPTLTRAALEIKAMNLIYDNISLMYLIITLAFIILFFILQKSIGFSKHVDLVYKKPASFFIVCSILIGTFVGVVSNIGLEMMSKTLPESWVQGNNESVQAFQGGNVYIMIIAVVVCAPIAEEIIFRGLIYNALKKIINLIPKVSTVRTRMLSMFVSAVISSALFGVYHGNILQGLYTGILSLFMVWIYEISGSLFSSMIVHAAFNFAGVPTQLISGLFGNVPSIIACSLLAIAVVITVYIVKPGKVIINNLSNLR